MKQCRSIATNVPSIAEGQELELQNFNLAHQPAFWQYCVLCLSSCNKLEEGDVVEKWYEPTLFP